VKSLFSFGLSFFLLFGVYASLSAQANYARLARQNDFSHYFPSLSGEKNFDTLDEAYAYMNEATAKFGQVTGKNRAKGGGAILNGPSQNIRNVRVLYSIGAFDRNGESTLTNETTDVQKALRDAIGANLVFLIFTGSKAACSNGYYLRQGWQFNNNSYNAVFTVGNNRYTADYRPNWTLRRVYEYLKE
jgi:hypothetical protein